MAPVNGGSSGGGRLEVIEVVYTTPTRRVSKAFDRELRQVVSMTSEDLLGRDGDAIVRALQPFIALPRTSTLAPLLDAYVDGDHIIMESPWVEGVDLLALLQASGTPGLPVTAVLAWLDQLGDAVRHLARHGLVHGDLRPANLVLNSEQRIVVIGLGTGLLEPAPSDDPRIDVRGVAATAAALLTGSSPSVGAISGTAQVSGAALQRALLPALDVHSTVAMSIDSLLGGLRQELNAALPTGVVTFLLTDIVGSTRQWEENEASMASRLARHDLLLAEAVEAAGGRLLKARGEGDATFSVFTRASAGVIAAVDGHAKLYQQTGLRVRMAVHTGEAELREADYFGRTVNRAARLRAVAPDGGILVSAATADLVVDSMPAGTRLVDRGAMALKDLDRAEHVYQVVGEGLAPAPVVEPLEGVGAPPPTSAPPRGSQAPETADVPRPTPVERPAAMPRATRSSGGRGRTPIVAGGVAVVALVVAAALVLGGGGDGDGGSDGSGRPSTTVFEGPRAEELLLSSADLPAEAVSRQALTFDDADEPCGQRAVDLEIPPEDQAAFSAQDAEGRLSITQALRRYTDPATARRAHALVVESFSCDSITIRNAADESAVAAVAPIRDLAGTSATSASYTTLDFGTLVVGLAMAHVGDYQIVVQYGTFDLRDAALEDQVRTLTEAALGRVMTTST